MVLVPTPASHPLEEHFDGIFGAIPFINVGKAIISIIEGIGHVLRCVQIFNQFPSDRPQTKPCRIMASTKAGTDVADDLRR